MEIEKKLKNISFALKKGEIVSIVGESGGGKTLICQLMQQLYAPESGQIVINQTTNLANIEPNQWRTAVGIVPQQVHIFNGSLIDNICFDAAPEAIQEAFLLLERYGFVPFIESLPQGVLTILGEDGINLSGGQRQMIGLARALVARPQLLILDEATAALDRHSEKFVLAQDLYDFMVEHNLQKPILLGQSMGGKTVMQFAMQYPEAFAQLVVVDIAPKFYPVHHHAVLQGLAAVPLDTLNSRQEAEQVLAQYENNPAVRQFLLKNLYRNDAGRFDWRMNLPVLTANIHEIGDEITPTRPSQKPLLMMRGELSSYVLDSDWPDILKLFPKATLATIPQADHWIQAEQPEAFLKCLLGFLG